MCNSLGFGVQKAKKGDGGTIVFAATLRLNEAGFYFVLEKLSLFPRFLRSISYFTAVKTVLYGIYFLFYFSLLLYFSWAKKLLVLQAHVPCASPTATCVLLAVRSAVRDKEVCL